jgi:hypothetical protein
VVAGNRTLHELASSKEIRVVHVILMWFGTLLLQAQLGAHRPAADVYKLSPGWCKSGNVAVIVLLAIMSFLHYPNTRFLLLLSLMCDQAVRVERQELPVRSVESSPIVCPLGRGVGLHIFLPACRLGLLPKYWMMIPSKPPGSCKQTSCF